MKQIFFKLHIILLFASCANVVTPKGGEKDTTPPVINNIYPANETTLFSSNSIIISFDEFIRLNNPNTQIIISPPIDPAPAFRTKGKSLYINFDQELRLNTTYSINFGESVVDLNEGNILKNFKYVFSTGNYIDSLSLNGTVINTKIGGAANDVLIMLYESDEDSAIYKKKPYYFTRTNTSGSFTLTNLKEGNYQLYALKDLNNNYIYDQPAEQVAFLDSSISVTDTIQELKLYLFQEEVVPKITFSQTIAKAGLRIAFNAPVKAGSISSSHPITKITKSSADTLITWFSDIYIDSVSIFVSKDGEIYDTAKAKLKSDSLYPLIQSTSIADSLQQFFQPLQINFSAPISKIDYQKLLLFSDSMAVDIDSIGLIDSLPLDLKLYYKWIADSSYQLIIQDSAFIDIYGKANSEKIYQFNVSNPDNFGSLIAKIDLRNQASQYILHLIESRKGEAVIVREKILKAGENHIIRLEGLNPGNYKLHLFRDLNNNNQWDTGNLSKGIQPEPIISYPKNITIKPKWENEIEVNIP